MGRNKNEELGPSECKRIDHFWMEYNGLDLLLIPSTFKGFKQSIESSGKVVVGDLSKIKIDSDVNQISQQPGLEVLIQHK